MNMTLVSHHYVIKKSKLFLVEKSDRWEKSFLKGRHFTVWISFMHSETKDMYFSVGVVTQWCYRRGWSSHRGGVASFELIQLAMQSSFL